MENTNILIVDDNPEIREIIKVLLEGEGFQITEAADGQTALQAVREHPFDLIILDIMMPGLNGYQTCLEIRKSSNAPILFLSARTKDSDKTLGFSSGGDDYLAKPFSYNELIARSKALIRRYQIYKGKDVARPESSPKNSGPLLYHHLKIEEDSETVFTSHTLSGTRCLPEQNASDAKQPPFRSTSDTECPDRHALTDGYIPLDLTATEYAVLLLLVKNRPQIFSAQRIYESVWEEPYYYGAGNTVMVHIRNLRTKIETDPNHPLLIKTVWGKGYRCD